MIRMYGNKFSDLQVLLTGGDATYLTTIIPSDHPLAVVPNLILIGLNCILHHHVQQKSLVRPSPFVA